jgi:hypothetical protein
MSKKESIIYSAYVGLDWANSKHDVCIACLLTAAGGHPPAGRQASAGMISVPGMMYFSSMARAFSGTARLGMIRWW